MEGKKIWLMLMILVVVGLLNAEQSTASRFNQIYRPPPKPPTLGEKTEDPKVQSFQPPPRPPALEEESENLKVQYVASYFNQIHRPPP